MSLTKKLISRADIAKYKQISRSVLPELLDPHIISAQLEDISPLLGERLFNDILNNEAAHTALLEGGPYVFDGVTYENYGLKAVISHYAHARWTYFGGYVDTPHGQVQKLNNANASVPTPDNMKKSIYTESRKGAYAIWENVERYLSRQSYPLFHIECCDNSDGSPVNGNMRFTIIGGY